MIIRQMPDIRFLIVGKGPMLEPLKHTVRQKNLEQAFIFTGSVPFDQVPDYMNCFDIGINFFKPVRTDPGDPIKMYEYMACGVPVIASPNENYGGYLESVGAGISVDPADAQKLVDKIVQLLKNPELRIKMGEAGRQEVTAHQTWIHRAQQIEEIVTERLSAGDFSV
jgi:glycosyltransferase involved in cell wall biosynthesis